MTRRAFTLIELSTVIMVLAMLAAVITPSLGRAVRGNAVRAYRADLVRMIGQARQEAIRGGQPVTMRVSEDDAFEIVRTTAEESAPIRSLEPGRDVEPAALLDNTGSDQGSDWIVTFYPDGTSDGGAIDLAEAGRETRYRIYPANGRVAIVSADDSFDEDRWEAGEFVAGG